MFLGPDLLPWLLLAFGAAMAAGNIAAMVRPRPNPRRQGELTKAPLRRTLPYTIIGLVVAVWGLASLLT